MKRRLFLATAFMSLSTLGFGQHVLKGKVRTERGTAPGVKVQLQDESGALVSTRTDMDGLYRLEVEQAGAYTLIAQGQGYAAEHFKTELNDEDVVKVKNFTLQPENKMVYRIPDFYFFPEEAQLTDHGKEMVYQVGKVLKEMPETKVELKPENKKNRSEAGLVEKKELTVKKYLIKLGVDADRFASHSVRKRS